MLKYDDLEIRLKVSHQEITNYRRDSFNDENAAIILETTLPLYFLPLSIHVLHVYHYNIRVCVPLN